MMIAIALHIDLQVWNKGDGHREKKGFLKIL